MTLEQLVRPNVRLLTPYSSARSEYKGQASVLLDANENPFETGLNRYPDPLQWQLKARLGELKGCAPERIFLGNGSDEAIDLLVRIFCEPRQDSIIILPPTYGMYQVAADIADVGIVAVPLTEGFQPDVPAILAAASAHTKILFLCTPNNPTGNDFDPALVQRLLADFPGIVVIDEAYIDFARRESYLSRIGQHDKLVVLQTLSKAWGLAGLRLGIAFAAEPIIQLLNKVKPPYNINQLTQEAALRALGATAQKDEWVHTLLAERARLSQALEALPYVEQVYPSHANYLLVRMADPVGVYQHLVSAGVIVRDRSRVLRCEGCLRITVGRPEENELLLASLAALA